MKLENRRRRRRGPRDGLREMGDRVSVPGADGRGSSGWKRFEERSDGLHRGLGGGGQRGRADLSRLPEALSLSSSTSIILRPSSSQMQDLISEDSISLQNREKSVNEPPYAFKQPSQMSTSSSSPSFLPLRQLPPLPIELKRYILAFVHKRMLSHEL